MRGRCDRSGSLNGTEDMTEDETAWAVTFLSEAVGALTGGVRINTWMVCIILREKHGRVFPSISSVSTRHLCG